MYISANSAEQLGLAWSVQADSAKLYSLSCQNVTAKGCVCTGALDAKCLRHAGAFTKGEVHFCCHQSNSLVYFDDQAIAIRVKLLEPWERANGVTITFQAGGR